VLAASIIRAMSLLNADFKGHEEESVLPGIILKERDIRPQCLTQKLSDSVNMSYPAVNDGCVSVSINTVEYTTDNTLSFHEVPRQFISADFQI
jgi:hypothetical protein